MPTEPTSLTPARLVQLMRQHRLLLLGPAVAGAVLAAAFALVTPRDWRAEQGLLIRSDAAGYADQRLGKFTDLSEMKTVQETLLELARSQSVVNAVLGEVDGLEPTRQGVADFRDKLRLNPPGGAEFGKTEVFYIGMLDPNRDRAIALVESLSGQLDTRLTQLREERAGSMVAEVDRSVAVAREQLHTHVEKLSAFEQSVGADLIELRFLTSPSGGQSELGQKALAIGAERRQSVERRRENEALLAELEAAVADPSRILATPDKLLTNQPGLRRLKVGLVDAQLTVARTTGVRTADHPYVLAARRAQQAVQEQLVQELPSAIAGVRLELRVAERHEAALAAQVHDLRSRSAGLASKRSQYAELVANVEGQTSVLEGALKQLADAKSHRAGAHSASLLSPIDGVETGVRPVGPGRTTIAGAGGLAGLLLGATLVFVLHAPSNGGARQSAPSQAALQTPVAVPPTPPQTQRTPAPADALWGIESTAASPRHPEPIVSPWVESATAGTDTSITVGV